MNVINNKLISVDSKITKDDLERKKTESKGSIKAMIFSSAAPVAVTPVSLIALQGMTDIPKKMSKEQIKALNDAADKVLESTGLAAKGVKIHNVTNGGLNLFMPEKLMELINPYYATAKGKNAFFTNKGIKDTAGKIIQEANSIGINREKLPTSVFHEMGHAFNYNSSSFWKIMQKARIPAMIIASLIAVYCALTKTSKAKEGQELNKKQKANNFIRENSGKLAFAAMLPVVAEETMASIRGCKWAKTNLTKDLAKKVLKTNVFGAVTYVATAVGLGFAAYAATKIKDKAMEKANKQSV